MPQKWRKNLWENTGFPDNYTDVTFLQDLRTNLNVRRFTFWEALNGATRLSSQICCITSFLITFYILYMELLSPSWVLLQNAIFCFIGYLLYIYMNNWSSVKLIEDIKTLLTVLVFGYLFAPLLHTLTGAISTDTIFSMTCFVMLMNLLCHDYGLDCAGMPRAISISAAIFGALCLASRLSTSYHAFVLLISSVVFFVLCPMFNQLMWKKGIVLLLVLVNAYALYYISFTVFFMFIVFVVFVNFVCPFVFVCQQSCKHNIHGPWDEAMVDEYIGDSLFIQ